MGERTAPSYAGAMPSTRSLVSQALDRPGIRVRTVVQLRWAAIIGQSATLAWVAGVLHFPMPWGAAIAAVAASILLNTGLSVLYPRGARLTGKEAAAHLGFDLFQLGTLLFLTGGVGNPFAVLMLVPVTISASVLSRRATLVLVVLGLGLLVLLWRWALPLPWVGPPPAEAWLYRAAVVIGIATTMAFLAFYAWQVSEEGRNRQKALIATHAALERETKMSALGALAAAAAHELGGPLGTIRLIARDLEEQLGDDPDFGADIRLLVQEASRSRDILVGIAARAEAEDPFPHLALPALLHEVLHPFEPTRVPVAISVEWPMSGGPVVKRTPELLHGLANLLGNALRHAARQVWVQAGETADELWLAISDDGEGFDPGLLPRLGEPDLGPSRSRSGGTGLGIFIATTLIERTGGTLRFRNRNEGGARVDIRWPRAHIEAGATT